MKAVVITSHPNQGSTFRLIKYTVDFALEGKKVLFVSTEIDTPNITDRIHGYIHGTQHDSENLNITVRQVKLHSMDFLEPHDNFDVIVIDSHYLLFNAEDLMSQYDKLSNIIGDALLVINMQVTRHGYNNGCIELSRLGKFPEWVESATYIERVDGAFVETKIDVHTGTKIDVVSVYTLKMSPIVQKIPYLSKYV